MLGTCPVSPVRAGLLVDRHHGAVHGVAGRVVDRDLAVGDGDLRVAGVGLQLEPQAVAREPQPAVRAGQQRRAGGQRAAGDEVVREVGFER